MYFFQPTLNILDLIISLLYFILFLFLNNQIFFIVPIQLMFNNLLRVHVTVALARIPCVLISIYPR